MSITEIQKKVGHNPKSAMNSKDKFQMSRSVLVQSAMIYKNHGKADEETVAMLKKDFMLNEQQSRLIMGEINGKGGNKKRL